MKQIYYCIYI